MGTNSINYPLNILGSNFSSKKLTTAATEYTKKKENTTSLKKCLPCIILTSPITAPKTKPKSKNRLRQTLFAVVKESAVQ
jgi:hypothetical protein